MHWLRLARRLAWERAGSSNPARIAITAATTRSSIKLNPWRESLRHDFLAMFVLVRNLRFSSLGAMLVFRPKSRSWRFQSIRLYLLPMQDECSCNAAVGLALGTVRYPIVAMTGPTIHSGLMIVRFTLASPNSLSGVT